jgi:predicted permease
MNGFLHDLRFGLRQLVKRPGFAAAAILTLALGIGANTAVFSVLSGYLLKPLPYPHGERLAVVQVYIPKYSADYFGISTPDYKAIEDHTEAFSNTAIYQHTTSVLKANGRASRVTGFATTASLFQVLGVQPLLGRTFAASANQPGRGQQVVISYRLWQSAFGGEPGAIGRTLQLSGKRYRVIGIMPRGFAFPNQDADFWRPLTLAPSAFAISEFVNVNYDFIGRLKPSVSLNTLQHQLGAAVTYIGSIIPAAERQKWEAAGFEFKAVSFRHQLVGNRSSTLLLLQGAVLLVLLITCVNVANLLLSRILGRSHEMAMRAALGATRAILARQLLVEGICLTIPGGLAGVALGWLGMHFLAQSALGAGASVFDIAFDWRIGLFAVAVVGVTTLLISVLPILHLSKTDVQSVLQEGGRVTGGGRGGRRVRNALVVAEITLATALLAGSGLLLHSFINLQTVNTGFRKSNALIAGVLFPPDTPSLRNAYDRILKQVRTVPGVEQAGLASLAPLPGGVPHNPLTFRGRKPPSDAVPPSAATNVVTSGYFRALGIPILRGRNFGPQDTHNSRRVAIIDSDIAKKYFSGVNPIGRQLRPMGYGKDWYTIVGVVPAIKMASLSQAHRHNDGLYLDASQVPQHGMRLILHTATPPAMLIKPLHTALARAAPSAAVYDVQTMHQRLGDTLRDQQTTMVLLLSFGGIALALAVVGVYAVMSYAVGQRRAECGVRLALGARPVDLLWLILKDGLKLLAIGLVAGLGLAVVCGYLLSSRLFGVAPFDPVTLIGSAVVLCAITLAACYLPARRAAKLDPAIAIMEQ